MNCEQFCLHNLLYLLLQSGGINSWSVWRRNDDWVYRCVCLWYRYRWWLSVQVCLFVIQVQVMIECTGVFVVRVHVWMHASRRLFTRPWGSCWVRVCELLTWTYCWLSGLWPRHHQWPRRRWPRRRPWLHLIHMLPELTTAAELGWDLCVEILLWL